MCMTFLVAALRLAQKTFDAMRVFFFLHLKYFCRGVKPSWEPGTESRYLHVTPIPLGSIYLISTCTINTVYLFVQYKKNKHLCPSSVQYFQEDMKPVSMRIIYEVHMIYCKIKNEHTYTNTRVRLS